MKKHLLANKLILFLFVVATSLSVASIIFYFKQDAILAYGDAESHLNIAKRVTHSLTPGLAQLGGIWLPLPHILLAPFTFFDPLWRSGIAGSIVSGIAFIITAVYVYKLTFFFTKNIPASLVAFFVFSLNPNILYLQTTAMTEIPLIMFFTVSVYYLLHFLRNEENILSLILAAFFALCASLSRYDGWSLVIAEGGIIALFYGTKYIKILLESKHSKKSLLQLYKVMEGKLILFSTLAFPGILLWILWDYLILGDPLYFTNSPFSAKSQQMGWLEKGELPAFQNIPVSLLYYSVTSYENIGYITTALAVTGLVTFLFSRNFALRFYATTLLFVPFIFYVATLYLGQSVIFIPRLTPHNFEWNLFNVRYGTMMVPAAAFFVGYLSSLFLNRKFYSSLFLKPETLIRLPKRILVSTVMTTPLFILIIFLLGVQFEHFLTGKEKVITYLDGSVGLSSADESDALFWVQENYDGGLVLLDDYARTMSVIKSGIPMQNVIYIGNKPFWEESLEAPEKYAQWIIMQRNDSVWKELNENEIKRGRLYKYFSRSYTSPEILIFKRNNVLSDDPTATKKH